MNIIGFVGGLAGFGAGNSELKMDVIVDMSSHQTLKCNVLILWMNQKDVLMQSSYM